MIFFLRIKWVKWDMILFGDFVSERCHSVQPADNIIKS